MVLRHGAIWGYIFANAYRSTELVWKLQKTCTCIWIWCWYCCWNASGQDELISYYYEAFLTKSYWQFLIYHRTADVFRVLPLFGQKTTKLIICWNILKLLMNYEQMFHIFLVKWFGTLLILQHLKVLFSTVLVSFTVMKCSSNDFFVMQ